MPSSLAASSEEARMQMQAETRGAVQVVRVRAPRIDAAGAVQFKERLRALAGDRGRVLLDLEEVTFVDSSGLGAIVAAMKMLAPERRLELAALSGNVARVFALTRMDSVFVIHPDAESALEAADAS
jgi:anti-sigma B factor antagonist